MFDLIIKKGMAVLPDAVEVVDIAVKNGVIAAIAPTIDERAVREINALGPVSYTHLTLPTTTLV